MSTFLPPRAFPLSVQPGASVPIDGPGIFARIQTASGPLRIGFDLGTPFDSTAGKAYQCFPGENFSRVTIENPSQVDVLTVTVLVGRVIEFDDTLQVVGNVANLALDGTDGTGIIGPAGAVGIRGWLSGIYESLRSTKNVEFTPTQGVVPVAAAGTPVRLSAVDAFVDQLDIRANTANVGSILVGFAGGAGNQHWELQPSEWRGLKAPNGKRINLKNVWIDAANNGDGVVYESHV
jgi:hypothetical protein